MRRSFKWSLSIISPTKNFYAPLLSRIRAKCPTHLILLDMNTQIIFGEEFNIIHLSSNKIPEGILPIHCNLLVNTYKINSPQMFLLIIIAIVREIVDSRVSLTMAIIISRNVSEK